MENKENRLQELKAAGYDCLAQLQQLNGMLSQINAEIEKVSKELQEGETLEKK